MQDLNPQQARLYDALSAWARDRAAGGHAVPSPQTMARVAAAGHLGPDTMQDQLVAAWSDSILWMIKQLKFGVNDPHLQLPRELQVPKGGPPPPDPDPDLPKPDPVAPVPPESSQERDFRLLREWHSQATKAGKPGVDALRDQHLRQVANSPWRTVDQISQTFPPSIAQFAAELADVLSPAGSNASPAAAPLVARAAPPVAAPAAAPHVFGLSTAAPAAAPTQHGASLAAPPPPTPAASTQISEDGFAPYEFGQSDEPIQELRISGVGNGSYRVVWPAHASGEGIYRLVASDGSAPYSPDAARVAAITMREAEAVDAFEHEHAVRHYQVWWNPGRTEQDAKFNQPVLYAETPVVAGVVEADLREDEGRVIGQWRARGGTNRVQVFRIPISRARQGADPAFRILEDSANLGGFVDTGAARGERYLYQVFAEAEVDGVLRLSPVWAKEVLVSSIHEPVRDLQFQLSDDEALPLFHLSWTAPPGGQVVVHRTARPPEAGSNRQALPQGAMDQIGLGEDTRLAHPLEETGDRVWMRQVPWPSAWTRAYFTAVVVSEGRVYVGNTVVGVRIPPVGHPKIVERVDREVLTFEWPAGAGSVLVFVGPKGMPSDAAMHGQPREITRSDYERNGGLTFSRGELNANGCTLHIVSVDFDGGSRVLGTPVVLEYAGVLRLSYTAKLSRSLLGKPTVTVAVSSEIPMDQGPGFSLVFNERGFPLTITDGIPLGMIQAVEGSDNVQRVFVPSPLALQASEHSTWRTDPESWQADVGSKTGFVRLFAALPNPVLQRVALLDPSIDDLRIRPLLSRKRGD